MRNILCYTSLLLLLISCKGIDSDRSSSLDASGTGLSTMDVNQIAQGDIKTCTEYCRNYYPTGTQVVYPSESNISLQQWRFERILETNTCLIEVCGKQKNISRCDVRRAQCTQAGGPQGRTCGVYGKEKCNQINVRTPASESDTGEDILFSEKELGVSHAECSEMLHVTKFTNQVQLYEWSPVYDSPLAFYKAMNIDTRGHCIRSGDPSQGFVSQEEEAKTNAIAWDGQTVTGGADAGAKPVGSGAFGDKSSTSTGSGGGAFQYSFDCKKLATSKEQMDCDLCQTTDPRGESILCKAEWLR